MEQGEKSITNRKDLSEEAIECHADATGYNYEMDNYDSGAVDDYGFLMSDAI